MYTYLIILILYLLKVSTLDYQIVVGLRLFINQIFFGNVDETKSKNDRNAQIDVKMYYNRDVKTKATLIPQPTPI